MPSFPPDTIEAPASTDSFVPNATLPDPFIEGHLSTHEGDTSKTVPGRITLLHPWSSNLPSPPSSLLSLDSDASPPSAASDDGVPAFSLKSAEGTRRSTSNPNSGVSGRKPIKSFCTWSRPKPRTPGPSPDRFIPIRRSPTSSTKSFHMSKPVNRLSTSEKLLRRRSASPDPFSPTPHGRNGTGAVSSSTNRGRPRARPGVTGATGVLGLRRDAGNATRRQASVGAVWNVGGTTAATIGPVSGVQDGRGRLLGSGTNAPMYNSRFLEGDTPDQDLEKHEGRLALAFDFDQAEKVLGFVGSSDEGSGNGNWPGKRSRSCSATARGAGCTRDTRTIWKDNKWMKEGAAACKYRDFVLTLARPGVCDGSSQF
jgi:hypothetical protein